MVSYGSAGGDVENEDWKEELPWPEEERPLQLEKVCRALGRCSSTTSAHGSSSSSASRCSWTWGLFGLGVQRVKAREEHGTVFSLHILILFFFCVFVDVDSVPDGNE